MSTAPRPRPLLRLSSFAVAVTAAVACGKDPPAFIDGGPVDALRIDADLQPGGVLPSQLDLGAGDCGGAAMTTFMVTNTGGGDLTYGITSSEPTVTVVPAGGTILAGTSTTFTVTAQVPAAAIAGQALMSTLTVTTNVPGRASTTVPVRVTPRGATITIEPASVGFGQAETGTMLTRSFTVRNTGTAPAMVTVAAPDAASFTRSFGAAGLATVAAGADVTGMVSFQPTQVATSVSSSAIVIGGAVCGARPAALAMTGEGVLPGGVLVQGIPIDFGPTDCGAASGARTFTLVNTAQQPSPFDVTLLADAEGDQARYQVVPASGTLAAQAMQVITVTRLGVPIPASPRAYDARVRVHTTLPMPTDVDFDLRQTLRGPVLTASTASIDFGYVPGESSDTASFTLANTGTTAAVLSVTTPPDFDDTSPAMLAVGASGVAASITYNAVSDMPVAASATINAQGACSAPIAIALAAGNGPLADLADVDVSQSCPPSDPMLTSFAVDNRGNQPLNVTCSEQGTSGLAPVLTPSMFTVMPGLSQSVDLAISAGAPVRSGVTTATMRCQVNEPLHPTRSFAITRTIDGADIVLAAPAPLDFTCFEPATKAYSTRNAGNAAGFLFGDSNLPFPMVDNFTVGDVAPGQVVDHSVEGFVAQFLGGVPDPCSGSGGNPGDVAFEGTVGASGGSGGVCSVTPASLPVILRYGNIAERPAAAVAPSPAPSRVAR